MLNNKKHRIAVASGAIAIGMAVLVGSLHGSPLAYAIVAGAILGAIFGIVMILEGLGSKLDAWINPTVAPAAAPAAAPAVVAPSAEMAMALKALNVLLLGRDFVPHTDDETVALLKAAERRINSVASTCKTNADERDTYKQAWEDANNKVVDLTAKLVAAKSATGAGTTDADVLMDVLLQFLTVAGNIKRFDTRISRTSLDRLDQFEKYRGLLGKVQVVGQDEDDPNHEFLSADKFKEDLAAEQKDFREQRQQDRNQPRPGNNQPRQGQNQTPRGNNQPPTQPDPTAPKA